MRMRHIIIRWPARTTIIFSTLSHKQYDWRKKLLSKRGSADKSVARPSSRCRRTESIVLLEGGFCSCAELQDFSCCRGWKEARQATRVISKTWRRQLSSGFIFLQVKAPNEIHAILTKPLRETAPPYATVKNWVVQFNRGDFSTCYAPRPGWPKKVTAPKIIYKIRELILEMRQISAT